MQLLVVVDVDVVGVSSTTPLAHHVQVQEWYENWVVSRTGFILTTTPYSALYKSGPTRASIGGHMGRGLVESPQGWRIEKLHIVDCRLRNPSTLGCLCFRMFCPIL